MVFEISVVTLAFGYLVLPLTAIGVAIGSATNVFAVIDQVRVICRFNIHAWFMILNDIPGIQNARCKDWTNHREL